MVKKGFSDFDNKYYNLFKKRPLLIKNSSYSNFNSQISPNNNNFEKPNISTGDKLNQIIQNLKMKKKLRNKFLRKEFKNENNIFEMNVKDLLKKNKLLIEKKRVDNKVEKLDGIRESIQRLINHKKRYGLEESLVKLKLRENNKVPSICSYNPNYKSISKHTPIAHLQGHHTINLNNLKNNKDEENNRYKMESLKDTNDEPITNEKYIFKNSYSINSYNYKKHSRNNLNFYKGDNYSFKRNNKINNIYGIYDSFSGELSQINPEKVKKNVSVPDFNKMISRDENNYIFNRERYLADYLPNYDSIYSNANKFIDINKDLYEKKVKLRKIISCSNPPTEYLLLPILNN